VPDFLLRPAAVSDLRKAYRWYQAERAGTTPQLERVLDLDADVAMVRKTYAHGVTLTKSVGGEGKMSTGKPWWKFW